MEERIEENIKKENQKAKKKFLVVTICSLFLGMFLGAVVATMNNIGAAETMVSRLQSVLGVISAFAMPGICALILIPSLLVMKKAKAMWSSWDGENEEIPETVEANLKKLSLLHTITLPMSYLILTLDSAYDRSLIRFFLVAAFFLLYLILLTVHQKQVLDLLKRINPEKRGSVYDFNLSYKWLRSSDEAEKKRMGEAALSTVFCMEIVYPIAWVILLFLKDIFGFGTMPAVAVIILWCVSMVIYQVKNLQLSMHR